MSLSRSTIYFNHKEKIRYLLVGAWNTLFGYGAFVVIYWLLPLHYMILVILTNIIAITNAYICYKLLVFKTQGNYLKEYLRFYVVYGGSMVLGLVLLPLFVEILRLHPVVAQTIIIPIGIIISYLGHRQFSFRRRF
jgi:putative flippase GtrA